MRRPDARRPPRRPDVPPVAPHVGAAVAVALLLGAGAVAAQTQGASPGDKPLPSQPALPSATPPQPALPSPSAGATPIAPTASASAGKPPAPSAPEPAGSAPAAPASGAATPGAPASGAAAQTGTATSPTPPPAGATADATRGTATASAASAKPAPYPETPARTPLPPGPDAKELPWKRHLEIGGDFAFVQRAASEDEDGNPSGIRYAPAAGFGIHGRWELFKYLRFSAYYLHASHTVDMPAGSGYLGQAPASTYDIDKVSSFSLGAKLSPTLPLSDRARAWLTIGAGWGRMEFPKMTISDGSSVIEIDERADAFVEFPMGVGASFDLIPRWLSVEVEITGALVTDQPGDGLEHVQALDSEGHIHDIGGFPVVDGTFVQTVGLSLIL